MSLERRLKLMRAETHGGEATLKVAFATADMRHVDQHFGAAEAFVIHGLDACRTHLLEVTQFGRLDQDGNENKLAAKIAALEGCAAVYCQAIGASAVNQLLAKGIRPLKVAAGTPIGELLDALRQDLNGTPPLWLTHAMDARRPRDRDRFDRMDEEGWSE